MGKPPRNYSNDNTSRLRKRNSMIANNFQNNPSKKIVNNNNSISIEDNSLNNSIQKRLFKEDTIQNKNVLMNSLTKSRREESSIDTGGSIDLQKRDSSIINGVFKRQEKKDLQRLRGKIEKRLTILKYEDDKHRKTNIKDRLKRHRQKQNEINLNSLSTNSNKRILQNKKNNGQDEQSLPPRKFNNTNGELKEIVNELVSIKNKTLGSGYTKASDSNNNQKQNSQKHRNVISNNTKSMNLNSDR